MPPKKAPVTRAGKKSKRVAKKVEDDSDTSSDDMPNEVEDDWEDLEAPEEAAPAPVPTTKSSRPRSGRKPKPAKAAETEREAAAARRAGTAESKKRADAFITNNIPQELRQSKQTMPDSMNSDQGYIMETFLAWAAAGCPDVNGVLRPSTVPQPSAIPPRPFDTNFEPRRSGGSYVAQAHFRVRGNLLLPPRPFQVDMQPYLQWLEQNHTRLQQQAVDALRAAEDESAKKAEKIINTAVDGLIEAGEQLARLNLGTAEPYEPPAPAPGSVRGDNDDNEDHGDVSNGDTRTAGAKSLEDELTVVDEIPPLRTRGNSGRRGARGRAGDGLPDADSRGRGHGRGRGTRGGKSRGL